MDRRKNLLPKSLIAAPMVLGAAFVLWPFAAGRVNDSEANNRIARQIKPPSQIHNEQAIVTVKAHMPLAPRLLPHVETRRRLCDNAADERNDSCEDSVRHAAFPLAAESNDPSAANDAKRAEEPKPLYSWLLEDRAEVPVKNRPRSEQLERIAREADSHTRHGFSLANRGAYYSARAEFVKALRLVAQGLDAEHQTSVHGRALRAGLNALDESDDFIPTGSQLESELNFQAIIGGHQTPVLKLSQPKTLTSLEALRRYFSFAQYQLGVAGGGEAAASMPLHALAKLYASSLENPTVSELAAKSKAMTCFQAALICYPGNYLAANDLGVLLAGAGRFEDARAVLEAGAESCPHSAIWRNLVVVYRRLGLEDRAWQAELNRQHCLQEEIARREALFPGAADPRVFWLSPEEFAKTYAQTLDARQPLPVQQTPAAAEAEKSPQTRPDAATGPQDESRDTSRWSWNILDNLNKVFK